MISVDSGGFRGGKGVQMNPVLLPRVQYVELKL